MSSDRSSPAAPAPDPVVARFLTGSATAEEWDHPAHLRAFQHLLRTEGSTEAAYERMRALILLHNARVSPNGEHGRYHETVTRYFVAAVATAGPGDLGPAQIAADPALDREAPLRHWSRELLLSDQARATWVAPDLEPLPWPVDGRGAPIEQPCRCA